MLLLQLLLWCCIFQPGNSGESEEFGDSAEPGDSSDSAESAILLNLANLMILVKIEQWPGGWVGHNIYLFLLRMKQKTFNFGCRVSDQTETFIFYFEPFLYRP